MGRCAADGYLVHLATVTCDKENSDNYSWPYGLMKTNADMDSVLDSNKATMVTEQDKSHEPALARCCRRVIWEWCLRHIIGKFQQKVGQVIQKCTIRSVRVPLLDS